MNVHRGLIALVCSAAILGVPSLAHAASPVTMVNPIVGSSNGADTFPGPDYPLGMIQFGPDTTSQPSGGGYEYTDKAITGFSLTHVSGPGCPVANDLGILPVEGNVAHLRKAAIPFTHEGEEASPGWYAVSLGNPAIGVSTTATLRTALAAFAFPGGAPERVIFNLGHSGTQVSDAALTFVGARGFEGHVTSGGFCNMPGAYTVYFAGEFDRPFSASAASVSGPDGVTMLDFGTRAQTVKLRVGISYVDAEGARKNLRAEATTWDLDVERSKAVSAWSRFLSHAQISGGTSDEQHSFWTALYHSLMHPNIISDVDGRYPGFDGKPHRVASGHLEYGTWSGWDIYRTQVQLLAFLYPHETSDMIRSLLDANDQLGWMPRWALVNDETSVMNGDPAPAIVADAYFFGARDYDTRKALRAMVHEATANTTPPGQGWYAGRNDIAQYERLGYVDSRRENSVAQTPNGASETLEYAISDFAIARVANDLGDAATFRRFYRRSGNWANLFDTSLDLIEPRDGRGAFIVKPLLPSGQPGFQEGNAAQYTWEVPQDQSGLIRSFGGDAAVLAQLDRFFATLPQHDGDWNTAYIALNNEPSFGAPFMYLSAHAPAKAQSIVRLIESKYFGNTPGGEPGNDDLGAMSAMYLWETCGFYPQVPGTAMLDIGSPLFTHVELRSEDGRQIVVNAPDARTEAPYVSGLRVNGKSTTHTWVNVPRKGSLRLDFALQRTPSAWGSKPGDEPLSFDAGIRPPPVSSVQLAAPQTVVDAKPGQHIDVPLTFDNTGSSAAARISWNAQLPVGATSGTVAAAPHSKAAIVLHATVPNNAQPGFFRIPIRAMAANGAQLTPVNVVLRVGGERAIANAGYIVTYFDGSVYPVDLTTGALGPGLQLQQRVSDGAAIPNSTLVVLSNRNDGLVTFVDMALPKALGTVKVGSTPSGIRVTPDGKTIWVASHDENTVTPIDVKTRETGTSIPVGVHPESIVISSDGAMLYAADQGSNAVSAVDLHARKEIARIPAGSRPFALGFGPENTLYVANLGSNDVTVIDLANRTATERIPVGVYPRGVAYARGFVYVANYASNTVSVIDAATERVVRTIETADGPSALAASPDGETVYVALNGINAYQRIDVQTGRVSAPVPVDGSAPRTLFFH
ncbi:MAG: GH92 family glycosyl hydrolase [Vulcanimicrobiaceae bacterium]